MSRRKGRVNQRFNGGSSLRSGEDVNPMNYISNLSDAMLVLAMGIMVALVLHWNVDLESKKEEARQQQEQVVSFQDDELESQEKVPENATQAGQVYYDSATDTYYIVGSDGQTQQLEDVGQ